MILLNLRSLFHETQIFWVILMLIGIYIDAACLFNWDFFFNDSKAWLFVKLFGRMGARIAYFVLGTSLFILGAYSLLGY